MDKVMFFAFKRWQPPQPKTEFDAFFRERILAGLSVLDNKESYALQDEIKRMIDAQIRPLQP